MESKKDLYLLYIVFCLFGAIFVCLMKKNIETENIFLGILLGGALCWMMVGFLDRAIQNLHNDEMKKIRSKSEKFINRKGRAKSVDIKKIKKINK